MIKRERANHVVISLSGGMDSSTVLLRALKDYKGSITCLSFDYGQKHKVELERARQLVDYINKRQNEILPRLPFPKVKYQVIKLDGLSTLLNSALVEGGKDVPEGHYEQDNMKATVVPNRNKIFASIIQAVALSIAIENKEYVNIALGIHAGDHSIYPDCRQEFRDADDYAFRIGNWDSEYIHYWTPYLEGDKFDILKDGERLCKELNLDFDEVYKRTNTSYKPILIKSKKWVQDLDNHTFGYKFDWYSDYKSASSVERVEAFIKLGRPDPVGYADETGVVSWDHVVNEVIRVLKNHNE